MRRPAVLGVRPAGLDPAWGYGLGRAWAGLGWAGWAGPAGLGWALRRELFFVFIFALKSGGGFGGELWEMIL